MTPYMSQVSRSNQIAALKTPLIEGTGLASSVESRTLRRWLCFNDSR